MIVVGKAIPLTNNHTTHFNVKEALVPVMLRYSSTVIQSTTLTITNPRHMHQQGFISVCKILFYPLLDSMFVKANDLRRVALDGHLLRNATLLAV